MRHRDPRQPFLTLMAPPPPPRQTLLPMPPPAPAPVAVTDRPMRPANLANKRALSRLTIALDDLDATTTDVLTTAPPTEAPPIEGATVDPSSAPIRHSPPSTTTRGASLFDPDHDDPDPDHRRIADGIYAVDSAIIQLEPTTWGEHDPGTRTLKIKRRTEDTDRAWVGVGFLRPDGRVSVWRSQRSDHGGLTPAALDATRALDCLVLANDPTAHGFAYALLSGTCWVCGTQLADPVSIASGIGPDCARKLGIDRRGLDLDERAAAAAVTLLTAF